MNGTIDLPLVLVFAAFLLSVLWLIALVRRNALAERERERQDVEATLRDAMRDAETLDARLRRWEQESYGVSLPTTQDGATDLT